MKYQRNVILRNSRSYYIVVLKLLKSLFWTQLAIITSSLRYFQQIFKPNTNGELVLDILPIENDIKTRQNVNDLYGELISLQKGTDILKGKIYHSFFSF